METMKKRISIVELQLVLQTLQQFKDDKNENIRRAVVDLIERIYKDLKR